MAGGVPIVALVLAAGYSSRMGFFKPLARLGDSSPLEQAIMRFRQAGVQDVRVVVGHRAEDVIPVVERLGARWVLNQKHDRGMFSSVREGVLSFESDVSAFFLLPVDIPLVRPHTIRELLNVFDPNHPEILYPSFEGERGHPPLIPTAFLPHDLPEDYPGGLRALLERYEGQARDVEVSDQAVLMDCDTPEDYQTLVRHCAMGNIPTEVECEALWSRFRVDEKIVAHCSVVAEVARILTVHLKSAGLHLSLPLVLAAGRLHDLLRDQPDHAGAGARLLASLGYPEVAVVVASHMNILPNPPALTEAEVLYFADKCVAEDRLVTLEERFARAISRSSGRPDVLEKVEVRLNNARVIEQLMQSRLGCSPFELIQRYARSIRAASLGAGHRTVYLIRHGAIRAASEPRRYIGQLDLPLLEEGRQQAARLRDVLSGVRLSAVYCSDLRRTVETAEAIAEPHGLTCLPRPDLREIGLGQWEGLTFEEVRSRFPGEYAARGQDPIHYRTPGGESFHECTLRVIPAFYEIIQSTRGNVAIVAHAGVNRIILSQVLGKSLDRLFEIAQEYGCLNVIRHRNQVFEVTVLNDVPDPVD